MARRKHDGAGRPKGGALEERVLPVVAVAALAAGAGKALAERATGAKDCDVRETAVAGPADSTIPAERDHDASPGGIKDKLRRATDRRGLRWVHTVLDVQERYSELNGNNLASAVTLQAFLSLFPLLLVAVAAIGFFSAHSDVNVAQRLTASLGLTGDAGRAVVDALETAQRSRRTASVVGLAGLFWSGLGLVGALQYAYDQVWQVQSRGAKDKAVGVVWLAGAALLFVFAATLTTALRWVPGFMAPVGELASIVVVFLLWSWTAKALPNTRVGWRTVLPGAILGTVGTEVLKFAGAYYVPKAVASSSQLYGSIGVAFALLAWLLFFGRLIVYSAVLDVVKHERVAGTVRAVVEVPRQPGVDPGDDVTRSGRVERDDLAVSRS